MRNMKRGCRVSSYFLIDLGLRRCISPSYSVAKSRLSKAILVLMVKALALLLMKLI